MEELALHCPALECVACACLEAVETCSEKRVEACGQLDRLELAGEHPAPVLLAQNAFVEEHRHQLLRKQGVAGGNPGEPQPQRRRRPSDQGVEQRVHPGVAERLEAHRHRPLGAALEQLRSRQAATQDRCASDHRREGREEVEQRRLGPLDVVDDHDQRTLGGRGRQELRDRPGSLFGGCRTLAEPEQLCDARRNHRPAVEGRQHVVEPRTRLGHRVVVVDSRKLAHDLSDRPEGDSFAVREASAADDPGPRPDPMLELGGESRLAHPRLSDHRDQPAAAFVGGRVELQREARQLALAPDERRPLPPRGRPDTGHLEQPVGAQGLRLPLRLERRDQLGANGVPHQPERRLAEQHLTGAGGLLEPRRHVNGVTGHERLAGPDDLAAVDADPHLDGRPEPLLELTVQSDEPRLHLERGPAGSQRVVLACDRHPEHADDCIADEFLDRAAVALERDAHLAEVQPEQLLHRLWIHALTERRRADEVTEHERREPAPSRRSLGQRRRAIPTELKPVRVLTPTLGTGLHSRSLRTSRPRHNEVRYR